MTVIIAGILGVLLIFADQITKMLAVNYFTAGGEPITIIKGILSIFYTENNGAGFSILAGKTLFLIIFTAVVMLVIIFVLAKGYFRHPLTDFGLCLVLSGGIGNLIDRIFRGGLVVDFIKTDFINFPIFNVADICVTVGAGLIILYFVIDALKGLKDKNG